MRVFWVFIGVIVLGAAAALGWSWTAGQRAATKMAEAQIEGAMAAESRVVEETRRVEIEAKAEEQAAKLAASEKQLAELQGAMKRAAAANVAAPVAPVPVETKPVVSDATPTEPATVAPVPKPEVAKPAAPIPASTPAAITGYETAPGVIDERADGTTLLDDTHVVKGKGTPDDPYRITWELLTSGEQDFDPRAGKKKIPGRLAFLNGRHVRISGYVAFPVMMKEPRELLAMLNQWDGCCIGVPPTPYDAVEVQLAKPVLGNDRFAVAGGVTGVFHVKPYVMGDWLVGLYLMDQAQLDASDFSGAGE